MDPKLNSNFVIVGIGHLMLDKIVEVNSEFIKKHNLDPNNAVHMSIEDFLKIEHEITQDFKISPGGTVYKALSVLQKIISCPGLVNFVGSIGDDETGNSLLKITESNDGMRVYLEKITNSKTGSCLVLLNGDNRSLVTFTGAGNLLSRQYILSEEISKLLKKATHIYLSMFFLAASKELLLDLADFSKKFKKSLIINLGAPFIVKKYFPAITKLIDSSEIIFGNADEYLAYGLCTEKNLTDLKEIGNYIVNHATKVMNQNKIIIITQGREPVLLFYGTSVEEILVPNLSPGKIKSTNGAGDAFNGGFLSQYIFGQSLNDCVKFGIETASQVIQENF